MSEFSSACYTAGQLNTMVKNIVEQVGEDGPGLLLQGKLKIEVIKDSIFNWLDIITVPATTKKFVAKKNFSKEIKLYEIWSNFTNWFLDGDGKVERPQGESELRYGVLTENAIDGLIINELGGEAKAETTLSILYGLLQKQASGEEGVLQTDGHANIFYIRDTSGILRAVPVRWYRVGGYVDARFVESPNGWRVGDRVFSVNS